MKKYKLIKSDFKVEFGVKLFRIKALKDFGDVKKGDLGGYVESENNLSQENNAWVFGEAQVYGNALVFGGVRVYGEAQVYGKARVYGKALVSGGVHVSGEAQVSGKAHVFGEAHVFGGALVSGEAQATKKVINIIGLKFNITFTDNHVQVGCKLFKIEEIDTIKYSEVKDEVSLAEFRKIKKIIKAII